MPYEQLPSTLLYRPEDILDRNVPRHLLFGALFVRLGHLQNLFLLERLLVKCGDTSGQDLLDIAKEMLGLIVGIFKHRDCFRGLETDFEWLVRDLPPVSISISILSSSPFSTNSSFSSPGVPPIFIMNLSNPI